MLLEFDSLDFFRAGVPVIRSVSGRLSPGLCWLRGANGVGKTTLLRLLGGALPLAGGSIRLAGLDSASDALAYRTASFWCNDEALTMEYLSARDFAELCFSLYRAGASERQTFMALAAELSIEGALDAGLGQLSLGQGRKLLLAVGLALEVKLLLIDEAFNGLDADACEVLRRELSTPARRANQIVLLTSHSDPGVPVDTIIDLRAGGRLG